MMKIINDDFPQFLGWPSNKVYFLENMAQVQLWQGLMAQVPGYKVPPGHHIEEEYQLPEEKSYVVITKEMDEGIYKKNHDCQICQERLPMVFNQDEEEWTFDDAKEVNGRVYHYPLCYKVGLRGNW